ncbi:hypothetical protein B0T25DRAFT_445596 [Lasiosphaeria hispida]|uniref:Protein YAE1 n=1 Tax=Lasiosphaeria hispida TaxID=260671 RepID=A0AAJ0HTD7_9PEZI|nr:hypothetical protein B0T25DRAFT_445596 [Lasiosphaeria hispida]
MLLRNIPDDDLDIFSTMASHTTQPPATAQSHGYHHGHTAENPDGANELDDVWGDDTVEQVATSDPVPAPARTHTHMHPSDVPRLQQEHTTAGYRDGITAAKASSVQAGFDEGFGLGATIGARAGQLLGVLEGLGAAVALQRLRAEPRTRTEQQRQPPHAGDESERVQALLTEARRELSVQSVFGPAYWADDGTWKYDVTGSGFGGEADVVFADVAAAHPLLRKWEGLVQAEAERYGVDWDVLRDEAAEERRRGGDDVAEPKRKEETKGVAQARKVLDW